MNLDPASVMREMFEAAIASAQPHLCVPPQLPSPSEVKGRLVVIGAGKASAAMARAVEDHWTGPLSGLVVTRYGYSVACQRIEIVEAAHPVPDPAGWNAAQRMMATVQGLTANDVVLCLISGGGSALLPLPLPGITLEDKQQVNRSLLASGASISEMNVVRRHLSAIKGGRLAMACYPARVITLLLSDVPGDQPADIASGPTVPDASSRRDALEILQRYGIDVPPHVMQVLHGEDAESIKPTDARWSHTETRMIATPLQALTAAALVAQRYGFTPHILGDALEGEARDVGKVLGAMALQAANKGEPFQSPCALLSGGETTVTLKGAGRGGRNVECLLAFAIATQGHPRIHALMGDTDGVDGAEEIAGAVMGPRTLHDAFAMGVHPRRSLDDNDGHGFFSALNASIVTGPTLTNVNDFRVILINP